MRTGETILGVHIEDQFLNMVSLRRTAKGLNLCAAAAEPLDAKAIQGGHIVSVKAIAQKIHSFAKANKLRSHNVVMSPSCAAVVLKSSEYFTKSDTQTKKQVAEQIKKYTLFGSQEIIFDYCSIDEDTLAADRRTVLEAITTQEVSDTFLAISQKAGLKLKRIEPAVLPLIKLVYGGLTEEIGGISLLLALESKAGTISVFDNTVPRLCQNLSIGISDIIDTDAGVDQLMSQLKNVLEYARSMSVSAPSGLLMRVAASCPSETLKKIAATLEQKLSAVTVKTVTAPDVMDFFAIDSTGSQEPPIFALAQTLAALNVTNYNGQLDLVSEKSRTLCRTQKEMSLTAKGMVAIVLLALAARVPFKMEMGAIEAASVGIEATNAGVMTMQEKIAFATQEVEGLKKKQDTYTRANEMLAPMPWEKVLQSITSLLPETVRIVSISSAAPGHFRLQGEAWVESDVRSFHKSLNDSEPIKTAKIEAINYAEKDSYVIVQYEILCEAHAEEMNSL